MKMVRTLQIVTPGAVKVGTWGHLSMDNPSLFVHERVDGSSSIRILKLCLRAIFKRQSFAEPGSFLLRCDSCPEQRTRKLLAHTDYLIFGR